MEREKLYELLSSLKKHEEIMIKIKDSDNTHLFWGVKRIIAFDNDVLIVGMYSCGQTNAYDYDKDTLQEDLASDELRNLANQANIPNFYILDAQAYGTDRNYQVTLGDTDNGLNADPILLKFASFHGQNGHKFGHLFLLVTIDLHDKNHT